MKASYGFSPFLRLSSQPCPSPSRAVSRTIETANFLSLSRSSAGLDFGLNMPESARDALVAGRWDPIQELLDRESDIAKKAKELHYV